jgi:para-nitrobenzyl esterase
MIDQVVSTRQGKIRGVELKGKYKGIMQFRGVPYAQPPTGNLRWMPPEDPSGWDGTRACDTYAPAAMQKKSADPNSVVDLEYHYRGWPTFSEDCLYLNITTGAKQAGEKRPVYIWLHGGALTSGYSYEIENDPSELARKGVVVVSIGHRLGVFGYLSLPQLTAEQGKSGNYGLMDQFKALDWIIDNIDAFGGDPDNITVGGESGGTWKAMAMAASPAAKGKIKRVIAESFLLWGMRFLTQEEAEEAGTGFLNHIQVDPAISLDQLRTMDAIQLVENDAPWRETPGDMVWDKDIVPYLTILKAFDTYSNEMDFIGGTNLGETNVFNNPNAPQYYVLHHKAAMGIGFNVSNGLDTTEKFYHYFQDLLGDLYDTFEFEKLVPVADDSAWRTARWLASQGLCLRGKETLSRSLILHRLFGAYMKKRHPKARVYSYYFSHVLPVHPEDIGGPRDPDKLLAFHSSEMWYAFNAFREGVPPHRPWSEADYLLGDKMSSYWANFMHTGDPNGEGLPVWPESGDNLGYIILDEEISGHQFSESDAFDKMVLEFALRESGFDI